MVFIPFEQLHDSDFLISEPLTKTQLWVPRGNVYNAFGKPKISHTFLWFKNCAGKITSSDGSVLFVEQNQLTYMAKGTEYRVDFLNTGREAYDTIVLHFQMFDANKDDIVPSSNPCIRLSKLDPVLAAKLEKMANAYKSNSICIPEVKSIVYQLIALICQKQKSSFAQGKFRCISAGIELMEQDSDLSIREIAARCGITECYFRRLFREYSGMSPMHYRQRHRIERAKQLLMADENYTIGEIAQELHYSDIYHFSKAFKNICGISPSQYLSGRSEI